MLISAVDETLRLHAQRAMYWSGRRFGWERRKITLWCGILATVLPASSSLALAYKDVLSAILGFLTSMVITGYFMFSANVRGIGLLERNQDWGAYTNWREWRWLRYIEIFCAPPMLLVTIASVMDGKWWETIDMSRPVLILATLYSLTINELPPKAPRKVAAGAHAHAGAR